MYFAPNHHGRMFEFDCVQFIVSRRISIIFFALKFHCTLFCSFLFFAVFLELYPFSLPVFSPNNEWFIALSSTRHSVRMCNFLFSFIPRDCFFHSVLSSWFPPVHISFCVYRDLHFVCYSLVYTQNGKACRICSLNIQGEPQCKEYAWRTYIYSPIFYSVTIPDSGWAVFPEPELRTRTFAREKK